MKFLKLIILLSLLFYVNKANATEKQATEIRNYFIIQGYTPSKSDKDELENQLGSITILQYKDKSINEIMFFVKKGDATIRKKAISEGKWLFLKLSNNDKKMSKWYDDCISGNTDYGELTKISDHQYVCVDFGEQIMFGY